MNNHNPTIGIPAGLLASVAMASMTVLVHEARTEHSLAEIVFFRSLLMVIFVLPLAFRHLKMLFQAPFIGIWTRSILGAIAMILYLKTLQMGHIGLANSLAIFTQVIVPLGAWIYLNEKLTVLQIAGIGLIIAAIFYLQSGPLGDSNIGLVLLGLGSAILAGVSFILLRSIAHRYPTSLIVFLIAAVTLLLSPLLQPDFASSDFTSFQLWGIAISALVMQIFMTVSFRNLAAAQALIINESFIVFAGIINVVFGLGPFVFTEFLAYFAILLGVALVQRQSSHSTQTL